MNSPICEACGKEFPRKFNTSNRACSRECGFEVKRIDGVKIRATTRELLSLRKLGRLSKDPLSPVSNAGKLWLSKSFCMLSDKPKAHSILHCSYCYQRFPYSFGIPPTYCSKRCASLSLKLKKIQDPEFIYTRRFIARKRVKTTGISSSHRSRARKAGVYYTNVKPVDILTKYKYKCAACGVSTPKEFRGKLDNRAPEVDHIIPLSKGGPHTEWNMQVLCRSCNGVKGGMFNNEFILKHLISC